MKKTTTTDFEATKALCRTSSHLIILYKKGNNRFDNIQCTCIRFIYDIYELLKGCKNCGLLLLPLVVGVCVGPLFSNFALDALYSSAIILPRKRVGHFALMWCG